MKIFDPQYLYNLTGQSRVSPSLCQHRKVDQSYLDVRQRLFNAIESAAGALILIGMPLTQGKSG
jgi:hypothetical protein